MNTTMQQITVNNQEFENCRMWMEKDFDRIPTRLINIAYKQDPDSIRLITAEYDSNEYSKTDHYEYLYCPKDPDDMAWIHNNLETIYQYGFLVYDSIHCGVLLGTPDTTYQELLTKWHKLFKHRHDTRNNEPF